MKEKVWKRKNDERYYQNGGVTLMLKGCVPGPRRKKTGQDKLQT